MAALRKRLGCLAALAGLAAGVPASGAVIPVTDHEVAVAENDVCSLIEAFLNARGSGQVGNDDCVAGEISQDTIVLPQDGSFVLTQGLEIVLGWVGLPQVTDDDVVVEGNGSTIERQAGLACVPVGDLELGEFRLFAVGHDGHLTLRHLELRNGCADRFGGAAGVVDGASLVLQEVTVRDGQATGKGGAILVMSPSSLEIADSTLVDNTASEDGGAIAIRGGGQMTIRDTELRNNSAGGGGGGLWIRFDGLPGQLVGERLRVIENDAANGAGVYVDDAQARLEESTLAGNQATSLGGGIFVEQGGALDLVASTLSGNGASGGGGGVVHGALTGVNVTIADNSASSGSGALLLDCDPDGTGCSATLSQTTITGNIAPGGALVVTFGEVRLKNSLVMENPGGDCSLVFLGFGTLCAQGADFDSDGSCDVNGLCGQPSSPLFQTAASAGLAALADNGGPTFTRAVQAGSPLLDAAPDCTDWSGAAVGMDQRGAARPQLAACDAGAYEREALTASALDVDPAGNHVLEPGESVAIVPTWSNPGVGPIHGVAGTLSQLESPVEATALLLGDDAYYGSVAAGGARNCAEGGICYGVFFDVPEERIPRHWDATALETLTRNSSTTWTLHLGGSFADVAAADPAYPDVERFLHRGATDGCGPGFCPDGPATRAQVARFLVRARHGSAYLPLACTTQPFADLLPSDPSCRWIVAALADGIFPACGADVVCPAAAVPRGRLAEWILRALGAPVPPDCVAAPFEDVPANDSQCRWIQELAVSRGISPPCTSDRYCPLDPITRRQAAQAIQRAWPLELYRP